MDAPTGRAGPQPMAERKAKDRAVILPVIGLILFMPPFADVFQIDVKVGGVPFLLVYLFVVWAALIVGGLILSRQLEHGAPPGQMPSPRGGGSADPDRGGG